MAEDRQQTSALRMWHKSYMCCVIEALMGDRKGQHSIRINDQWRICFRWQQGDACDVAIVDDH